MKDRPPIQFAALFATPQESAIAALVRPDDEFARDLRLGELDGLDMEEFLTEVERAVGAKLPADVAERVRTVRDLVASLAKLTK